MAGKIRRVTIEPSDNGGHHLEHTFKSAPGKSGAFMESEPAKTYDFGPREHGALLSHIDTHLNLNQIEKSEENKAEDDKAEAK
jgi:hypothetical protein